MTGLIDWTMPHLVVVPILLPMVTAAAMLVMSEGHRQVKAAIGTVSAFLGLLIALTLFHWVDTNGPVVYLAGNWPAPFGIVLVADRLSTLMLVLTSSVGFSAILFASARWDKAGVHFHPLAQLQLMGLSGAFLTGDLFNLFVFFEILLTASYGLLLHGSGRPRVGAGLHYIAVNLLASSLFLVGAALLYGVVGTLNLADLSQRVAEVPADDRGLLHAGASILAVAFLAKAAVWPINMWLVPTYSAATAPAAGFFAILTKVGVYAVLRVWTLLFSSDAGVSAGFGGPVLVVIGLITLGLGAVGMLGSHRLDRLAGFSVVISAGTLLAAIGFGENAVTAGAIFYLLSSTLAACAFFLLYDVLERWRNYGKTVVDFAPFLTPALLERDEPVNLDDEEKWLIGRPFPASTALVGFAFLFCVLLIAGIPPFSGFLGKVAMLTGLLRSAGDGPLSGAAIGFLAVVIASGLVSLVALTRAGIRVFWTRDREPPEVRVAEAVPLLGLLTACTALTVFAGPAMELAQKTAEVLHAPRPYREAVLGTEPVPPPELLQKLGAGVDATGGTP